jgi:hypothetical protein
LLLILTLGLGLAACDDDDDDENGSEDAASEDTDEGGTNGDDSSSDDDATIQTPSTYAFSSRFGPESSVSYDGQVARQVLIADLRDVIDGMGERITSGEFSAGTTTRADVLAILESYYDQGVDTLADNSILLLPETVDTRQPTYGDISSGKNLVDKTAGNDAVTEYRDWSSEFVGWADQTPEALIRQWFDAVADQVMTELGGTNRTLTVDGTAVDIPVYITDEGQHLGQLVEKFLLGAVNYAQAMDDYLDDDVDEKGLLTDNVNPDDGENPFTALEHQWDEGFGYFGAARDYTDYTDEAIANEIYRDSDGDGFIDLQSEFNFALAGYAAKRDLGSTDPATDFTQTIFDAFVTGRAIISNADGALSEAELDALKAQRDIAVSGWEQVMAANVAHYINTTLSDLESDLTQTANVAALAAHWSEMKAFALMLQFNPRKAISDADFATLHGLMGEAPVLPGEAGFDTYAAELRQARRILRDAYGFSEANVTNW